MAKKDELAFEGGVESPQPNNSEKLKALQAAMDKIEKSFGKGSIMKMGDNHVQEVEVIPTGSIALNAALGVGGYPKGRIIEIYGPESSGKTTLAIHAIAEAQKAGGIAAFIDAEHAFDRFYAAKLGVDIDNLWISQPDNGEQALEIAEQLIRSSAIDIIVIDSVAALTPKAEIEGDTVLSYPAKQDFLSSLLDTKPTNYVEAQILKSKLGEYYQQFGMLKNLTERSMIQARIPFELNIK